MAKDNVPMTQKDAFELAVLKFIDAYLDLNGEINSVVLTTQFPIHRTKASKILGVYLDLDGTPASLRYSHAKRKYEKGYLFKKRYLTGSSLQYLDAIELVFPKDA